MTEKRYVSDVKNTEKEVRIFDLEDEKKIFNIFFNELDSAICLNGALGDIITRLNEQHEIITRLEKENEQLKSEIAKLSYANEDLLTEKRNWFVLSNEYGELYDKHEKKKEHQRVLENKIHRMRKSIHKLEWLAHHRNGELIRENEQLKQQLLYDGDSVCDICKHEYLTPSGDYFISNCRKGHDECSKEDLRYCTDFEVKELKE